LRESSTQNEPLPKPLELRELITSQPFVTVKNDMTKNVTKGIYNTAYFNYNNGVERKKPLNEGLNSFRLFVIFVKNRIKKVGAEPLLKCEYYL